MTSRREARRRPRRAAPPQPRPSAGAWWAPAILTLLVALAFGNSLRAVLVWDDVESVATNESIRGVARSLSPPPDLTLSGRPVASASFAVNYALAPAGDRDVFSPGNDPATAGAFARNVRGYRLTNVAIHVAAALLLFGLVRRTLRAPRLARAADGHETAVAFIVAAAWAVHPLQTASVTYLVQRVEALMGLFYLATLYSAVRAWESATTATPGPGREATGAPRRRLAAGSWTGAAVAACALGMATKETMVTAPVAVVLWDMIFGPGTAATSSWRARIRIVARARRPLYAGLAASWLVLAAVLLSAPRTRSVGFDLGVSPGAYFLTQSEVLLHYLRAAFWPAPLCLDYDWRIASSVGQVAPALAASALLVGLALLALWRWPLVGFALASFLLILAPTSTVVPIATEVAADHRMYLPQAALAALAIVGGWVLLRRATPHAARAGTLLAAALIVVLAWTTRGRNEDFRGERELWTQNVEACPGSSRARTNLAAGLLQEGRYVEAETHLRAALALRPEEVEAQASLGVALAAQQRFEEAIPLLRAAVEARPSDPVPRRNLAEAYASQRRDAEAVPHFLAAIEHEPDDASLLNATAWLLATSPDEDARDGRKALELSQRAVSLTGGRDVISIDSLAAALAEMGRFPEAASTIDRALRLAERSGQAAIAPELQQRLQLYREGQAYRR